MLGCRGILHFRRMVCKVKERNCLVFKNVCGERTDVEEAACEDRRTSKLAWIFMKYGPEVIFNCDETVLFFNAFPDKTITSEGDSCIGGKRS